MWVQVKATGDMLEINLDKDRPVKFDSKDAEVCEIDKFYSYTIVHLSLYDDLFMINFLFRFNGKELLPTMLSNSKNRSKAVNSFQKKLEKNLNKKSIALLKKRKYFKKKNKCKVVKKRYLAINCFSGSC